MAEYKQDMPPAGGYAPVTFTKIPMKSTNAYLKMGIVLAISVVGWQIYYEQKKQRMFNNIELRCGKMALLPLFFAERDRARLKYFRKCREDEEKIMKDVPGWEVGKWRGMPVYQTKGSNDYYEPSLDEAFKQSDLDIHAKLIQMHKKAT